MFVSRAADVCSITLPQGYLTKIGYRCFGVTMRIDWIWTSFWVMADNNRRCQACMNMLESYGQVRNLIRTFRSTAQVCDVAGIPIIIRVIHERLNRRCDCGSGLPALALMINGHNEQIRLAVEL